MRLQTRWRTTASFPRRSSFLSSNDPHRRNRAAGVGRALPPDWVRDHLPDLAAGGPPERRAAGVSFCLPIAGGRPGGDLPLGFRPPPYAVLANSVLKRAEGVAQGSKDGELPDSPG